MPMLVSFCEWLENTPVGMFISGSTWAFPTIESIHVFFLVVVVGTIAIVDLRLLGVASRNRSVSQLSNDVLPITWGAFLGALTTGALLFSSKATHYLGNWPFRIKMLLLLLAGLNMLIFHFLTYRDVHKWDDRSITPGAARIAGALSLLFWIAVVGFGRWIGFTVR
ncbi:MAG: hypothetical protein JWO72_846 [Caulobacteraceae bacterium]|jgi:hypothetical protein|nr:hypothetical protein [Caulobacteraceae bacterium]